MGKNKLNELRNKIDDIDKKLIDLFEERMNIAKDIGAYKKENNIAIFNGEREKEVLQKNVNRLKDKNLKLYAEEFFQNTMSISRKYQGDKILNKNLAKEKEDKIYKNKKDRLIFNEKNKIGFQGVRGSFSEQALLDYFGEEVDTFNFETFEDVFVNLENKIIDYAILPLENSSTGAISDVYDLLRKYGFYIVGEKCIKVEHNILGIKGSKIKNIEEIYSHPQAFQQSNKFLKDYKEVKLIPYYNTAISAEYIKNQKDLSKGCIASKRASEIYGLEILEKNINNNKNNHTRFIIIGRDLINDVNNNKISVVFSLEHKVGTLYNALKYFSENHINMLKIESRPTGDKNWTYFFYIDFEGNSQNKEVSKAIELIKQNSQYFKILGEYIKDQVCE
ncbi:prephenate dehydratase [Clostridium oceanicum]|uniref:Bifunctional chorismate mutase/prephenate dehydratase n=1 Tax=Clostridium oceanicum TaxID=1543 RepID=A0ABN1JV08_9CLOT